MEIGGFIKQKITQKNLIPYMQGFDFILKKQEKSTELSLEVFTFNPKEAKHYQIEIYIQKKGVVTMSVATIHDGLPDHLIEFIIIKKLSEIEFFLKRLSRYPIYPVRK